MKLFYCLITLGLALLLIGSYDAMDAWPSLLGQIADLISAIVGLVTTAIAIVLWWKTEGPMKVLPTQGTL